MKKEITKVIEIQVGGGVIVTTLEEACREYVRLLDSGEPIRAKIHFAIKTKNGSVKSVTIRDDDDLGTIAYGNFSGLSNFLEVAKSIVENMQKRCIKKETNAGAQLLTSRRTLPYGGKEKV